MLTRLVLDSFEDKIKEALDAQIAARDSKVIEKLVKAAKLPATGLPTAET